MNNNLKLYIMDMHWRGCIVVLAYSEDEARQYMRNCYNYRPENPINEYELKEGLILENIGDS